MAVMPRLRTVLAAALGAALAIPAVAPATIDQVPVTLPDATPSCPVSPCQAVSRTIGYQAKVGTTRGVYTVPKDGRLVSWSVTLGKPGAKQQKFFEDKLGGKASAQIAVLRPGRKLRFRVVALGEVQNLTKYFGSTVEFPLETTIAVTKGMVIGLAVPTWAPSLAINLPADTSWRASRKKGGCEDTQTQTVSAAGGVPQFYCLYRTARLTYSARIVSTP
jgi:hypothetical protein